MVLPLFLHLVVFFFFFNVYFAALGLLKNLTMLFLYFWLCWVFVAAWAFL